MAPPKKYKQYIEYTIPLSEFYTKNLYDSLMIKMEYKEGYTLFSFIDEETMFKWENKYKEQISQLNSIIHMVTDIKQQDKKELESGYVGPLRTFKETLRGMMSSGKKNVL